MVYHASLDEAANQLAWRLYIGFRVPAKTATLIKACMVNHNWRNCPRRLNFIWTHVCKTQSQLGLLSTYFPDQYHIMCYLKYLTDSRKAAHSELHQLGLNG